MSSSNRFDQAVEHFTRVLQEAASDPLPSPPHRIKPRAGKTHIGPPEILALVSDVHVGKRTKSYSLDVFDDRLAQYEQHIGEQIDLHKPNVLHVALMGDIVDGDLIYPGHAFHIQVPAVQQYLYASRAFAGMIDRLSHRVRTVKVPCVPGNHGRQGRKGETHELANFDYLLCIYAEALLKNNRRVQFSIPQDWKIVHEVAGRRFLLHHGDAIQGGGSPNTIWNAALRWSSSMDDDWEVMCSGHFHSPFSLHVNGRIVLGNGTFVSHDDWVLRTLRQRVAPSQKILVVPPSGPISVSDFWMS